MENTDKQQERENIQHSKEKKEREKQEHKPKKEHADKDKPIVIKPGKSHAAVSNKNE